MTQILILIVFINSCETFNKTYLAIKKMGKQFK